MPCLCSAKPDVDCLDKNSRQCHKHHIETDIYTIIYIKSLYIMLILRPVFFGFLLLEVWQKKLFIGGWKKVKYLINFL